jgi:hypothetical protein
VISSLLSTASIVSRVSRGGLVDEEVRRHEVSRGDGAGDAAAAGRRGKRGDDADAAEKRRGV